MVVKHLSNVVIVITAAAAAAASPLDGGCVSRKEVGVTLVLLITASLSAVGEEGGEQKRTSVAHVEEQLREERQGKREELLQG